MQGISARIQRNMAGRLAVGGSYRQLTQRVAFVVLAPQRANTFTLAEILDIPGSPTALPCLPRNYEYTFKIRPFTAPSTLRI